MLKSALPSELAAKIEDVRHFLQNYESAGKRYFVSSSFQTHSIPLLHMLSQIDADIPVYFLNTGYHFPETLAFRDQIGDLLNIKITDVSSPLTKIAQRDADGRLMFHSDPDLCCYYNKVMPMEPLLRSYDVWINGVRRDQTNFRKNLNVEMDAGFSCLRYHPVLDWTPKDIWAYRKAFDLPEHPLEKLGILSVGCMPCTRSVFEQNSEREGRWSGMKKTECGLQTDLIK